MREELDRDLKWAEDDLKKALKDPRSNTELEGKAIKDAKIEKSLAEDAVERFADRERYLVEFEEANARFIQATAQIYGFSMVQASE